MRIMGSLIIVGDFVSAQYLPPDLFLLVVIVALVAGDLSGFVRRLWGSN